MWNTLTAIFSSFASRRHDGPLWVESFWFSSPVKLSNRVRTPMGSSVSVIEVCADIEYVIDKRAPAVRQVRISRKGTPGPSGRPCNMKASNTGEVWHAKQITPNSILAAAVEKELASESSNLRRIMFGKWGDLREPSWGIAVADGLNSRIDAEQLDELIQKAGRKSRVAFTYDSPKRGLEQRVVIVRRASGATISATDTKDDVDKAFRLDRISNARPA